MNVDKSQEVEFLKSEIAKTYGSRISSTSDFMALSLSILEKTGESLSESTLKRVWGIVSLNPNHRLSTLDILARYTGRKDFRQLVLELKDSSDFISDHRIGSDELKNGENLRIEWMPDRQVLLQHLEGDLFRVLDSGTSKLKDGDNVHISEFIQGHPLYVSSVVRNGKDMGNYVAGKLTGLQNIIIY